MVAQGMESDPVNWSFMGIVVLYQFSKSSIPQLDSAIDCGSCYASAIRSELATEHF